MVQELEELEDELEKAKKAVSGGTGMHP